MMQQVYKYKLHNFFFRQGTRSAAYKTYASDE